MGEEGTSKSGVLTGAALESHPIRADGVFLGATKLCGADGFFTEEVELGENEAQGFFEVAAVESGGDAERAAIV